MSGTKKFDFTFILPTKDREDIFDNIDNCFSAFPKEYNIKIIIIDGNKTDFLSKNKFIQENQYRISIIRQKKKGFMRACIIGLENLETEFFTFMYDDDFLSESFYLLYKKCIENKNLKYFVFGNGVNPPKKNINVFEKSLNFIEFKKEEMLKYYFSSKKINGKYLPVSPICGIFNKRILNKWIDLLKSTFKNKLIFFYLMKKNIGPDLLLFLISINEADRIIYCKNNICKFSSHEDSMSIRYGRFNLNTGYWFARLIFFKSFFGNYNLLFKLRCYLFLFIKGFIYMSFQIINKNKFKKHTTKNFIKDALSK